MKKTILALCSGIIISVTAIAQPVSDRAVIPVAVTLNQILRLHVTDGGNIEFVFNTITQYKAGIANSAFYNTNVVIASSTGWQLDFGAEDAALMPTDNPTNGAQLPAAIVGIPLDNIGFGITSNGANVIASTLITATDLMNDADVAANGLGQYGVEPTQNPMMVSGVVFALGNGGDVTDNDFTINWQCGIVGATGGAPGLATNGTSLLSQNIQPDRYVTNVLIDIKTDP